MSELKRVSKRLTEYQRIWLSRIEACEASGQPRTIHKPPAATIRTSDRSRLRGAGCGEIRGIDAAALRSAGIHYPSTQ